MTIQPQAPPKARLIRATAAAAMLLALLAIAGCGSSSSSSSPASTPATSASTPATTSTASETTSTSTSSAGSSSLTLEANKEGQLAYNTKTLSAKAGNVSIAFTNDSPVGHNVTIESSSGVTVGATPTFQGATKNLSVRLKPGTYKFFCSVPGHRMAGMEGTLTVK